MKLRINRNDGDLDVLLLKNKYDNTYSFVNLTKEHICPCRFNSKREAFEDLKEDARVVNWSIVIDENLSCAEITAGHRIDELTTPANDPSLTTPVDPTIRKSQIVEKDAVREAFISKAKELGIYYGASETGEFFSTETRAGWESWQARQSEVDQLKNELLAQDKRMMRTFALVQQWRDEAVSPRLGFEPDITGTLESCADELEKALGGGV